jgi:hypothetical protein
MKTKINAKRNWTLVALAGAFGLAGILVAGGGDSGRGSDLPMTIQPNDPRLVPPEDRVSRALFGALHERTIDSFSKRVGFGMSRIGAPARNHIGMEELWTILPPESAGYEVALIGVESEAAGTVYSVEVVESQDLGQEGMPQVGQAAPEEEINDLESVLNSDIVLVAMANPARKVEKQPASEIDRHMLDLLERDDEAPMLVDSSGERVMIYGGIRATQQRCIACHECEPGTLLGAFRYVFDVPAENGREVAVR